MAKAKVRFKQVIQDSQEFGSDDEHMVSRVFFDLEVGGRTYPGLHADIKQTVGSSFAQAGLEVSKPVGYDGPFNHAAFSGAAEMYYRGLIGPSASAFVVGAGSQVRMRHNVFVREQTAEFDIPPTGNA